MIEYLSFFLFRKFPMFRRMLVPRRSFGEVTFHRFGTRFEVTWLRCRSLCLVGSSSFFQWHYARVSRMPWVDIRRCPGFPNPTLVETLFHIPIWEYSMFYPNGFTVPGHIVPFLYGYRQTQKGLSLMV